MEHFTVHMCVSSALGVHFFHFLHCFCVKNSHVCVCKWTWPFQVQFVVFVHSKVRSGGIKLSAGGQQQRPQLQANIIRIELIIDPPVQIVQQPNGRTSLAKLAEWDPEPFYSLWYKREKHVTHCCEAAEVVSQYIYHTWFKHQNHRARIQCVAIIGVVYSVSVCSNPN